MDWIDDNVAVGNWRDAYSWRRLKKEGVDVIVDVRPFFDQRYGKYDGNPTCPRWAGPLTWSLRWRSKGPRCW